MALITMDEEIQLRAQFEQEFRTVVEDRNIFSKVATKLIAKAKNIYSPHTSVGVAKAYNSDCVVPISAGVVTKDELVLDRNIGNAIVDCEENLSYANFNATESFRMDLYSSVQKKENTQAVVDFVADATVVAGTRDLSTADLVREFLVEIQSANTQTMGIKSKVDGAKVVRAERHGKAFLAAGTTAFVNITSKIASIVSQSSIKGIDGNFVETPFGVTIINLGDAGDDANRLLWGTAGALTMGVREDMIKVDMGEFRTKTTAPADDLEITLGDDILEKSYFISARTKGKNGIFSQVQSLVSTQLMA